MTETVAIISNRLTPDQAEPMENREEESCTPQPGEMIIYEIGLDILQSQAINRGREIVLGLPRVTSVVKVDGHADFLKSMVTIIKTYGGVLPQPTNSNRTRDANAQTEGRKPDTRMSVSMQKDVVRYIVFKLSPELDWQFASNFHPFRRHSKDRDVFFEARRFNKDGELVSYTNNELDGCSGSKIIGDELRPVQDCKFAYFIFNGKAVKPKFQAIFNIYVELLERDSNDAIISRIPIVIDPDVRHPGGSEP